MPVGFYQHPTMPNVQFIIEQAGRIRTLLNGALTTDFLDLTGPALLGGERGLLGLAFAPDYASTGRFYVNFTRKPDGHTVVARFIRSAGNPLVADPASRFDLQWPIAPGVPDRQPFIVQPQANHNGGNLMFGPDGYLYIGLGDGGGGNDPDHLAQTPGSLLGKMLRIDVDVLETDAEGYDIPAGNPFLGDPDVLPEIWSFGLRNPWRYSFDDPLRGGTGALVLADVGQGLWEEVNYEPAGAGGRNYGWRNREGAHPNIANPPPYFTPLRDPIHEYDHNVGNVITGGVVYRGSNLGAFFRGRYFFADFGFRRVWSLGLTLDGDGEATVASIIEHTPTLGAFEAAEHVSHFGLDSAGEIYLVTYLGRVYRLFLELTMNGDFSSGMTGWTTFATPDPSYFVGDVVNGVLEFYRQPPSPGTTNQAVVFQRTGIAAPPTTRFGARFELGNSSSVRKRIAVLISDFDFNDLSVCTFWLPPFAPLRTYFMYTHTIQAWTNATISFYAATPGEDGGRYLLDNVSMRPDIGASDERTACVDTSAPAATLGDPGPNLIVNGDFAAGLPPWGLFGQIVSQISGGVFEFYRPPGDPAGVVLQPTGTAWVPATIFTATFQLGNSSSVRKRVTVILHDLNFSDLTACTFWLAPGQPLLSYEIRSFTTQAWANATLSVYAATVGTDQWARLDNVTFRQTPGQVVFGTECLEPPSPAPAGSSLLRAPSGRTTMPAQRMRWFLP